MSGKQLLWLFYTFNKTQDGLDGAAALRDIMQLRIHKDDMESFLMKWDRITDRMKQMEQAVVQGVSATIACGAQTDMPATYQ